MCNLIIILVFLVATLFDFGSVQLKLEHLHFHFYHFYPHPSTLQVYDPFFTAFVQESMLSHLIYQSHVDYLGFFGYLFLSNQHLFLFGLFSYLKLSLFQIQLFFYLVKNPEKYVVNYIFHKRHGQYCVVFYLIQFEILYLFI